MANVKLMVSRENYVEEVVKLFEVFLKTNTLVENYNFSVELKPNIYSDGTHEEYTFNFSATDEIVNALKLLEGADLISVLEIDGDSLY